jgi:hypothetical protein
MFLFLVRDSKDIKSAQMRLFKEKYFPVVGFTHQPLMIRYIPCGWCFPPTTHDQIYFFIRQENILYHNLFFAFGN